MDKGVHHRFELSRFALRLSAQQFGDVSIAIGHVQEKKKSWGDPIWGDRDNDGFLGSSCRPAAWLHSMALHLSQQWSQQLDSYPRYFRHCQARNSTKDWHSIAYGGYNGDGNLDVYVAEGGKEQVGGTLHCEMTCPFTTTPSLSQDGRRFAPFA